jgi:hypothetical protein
MCCVEQLEEIYDQSRKINIVLFITVEIIRSKLVTIHLELLNYKI